jgi:Putative peptidoglycan binding domain/Heterokaryon incompatibility protein Het-C
MIDRYTLRRPIAPGTSNDMLPAQLPSVALPQHLRFMPPLPEDEADLFNAGEAGHERIERDALSSLVGSPDGLKAIYFGNWQRDMSQVMAPVVAKHLGGSASLIYDLLFQVVDVLADAKFGRRLDRQRFGTYRWEEHIDNPRDFGIALDVRNYQLVPSRGEPRIEQPEPYSDPQRNTYFWQEDSRLAIPRYFVGAQSYVLSQLRFAMQYGPADRDGRGLEHFGNAMHTVEDMYAHSNFIEIGMNLLGRPEDTKTGRVQGSNAPLRDTRGRYRLTTGIFLMQDTLVSIEKLLLLRLEPPVSGEDASRLSDQIKRVIIRRALGSEALTLYDQLMRAWRSTGIPALMEPIQRRIDETINWPLRRLLADRLRPLATAAAQQTGRTVYPTPAPQQVLPVLEMSHSLVAKDDPHHRYHELARNLAIVAVRDFWQELATAWARGPQSQPNIAATRFPQLVDRYMNHPQAAGEWWVPVLGGRQPSTPPPQPPVRPPSPPPSGRPTLRRGSRGPAVRELQQRLNARGAGLVVDGIFGPRTQAAVRTFQRTNRLQVDGVVGARTWARLLGR